MAEKLHSAKSWAAATFQLLDLLVEKLKERGILSTADVEQIRADAMQGLAGHADGDFRRAAKLLEALYVPPPGHPS